MESWAWLLAIEMLPLVIPKTYFIVCTPSNLGKRYSSSPSYYLKADNDITLLKAIRH